MGVFFLGSQGLGSVRPGIFSFFVFLSGSFFSWEARDWVLGSQGNTYVPMRIFFWEARDLVLESQGFTVILYAYLVQTVGNWTETRNETRYEQN